ncbi:tetratricopeptide repeat protein 12-like [Cryptotermes secundus]|uniref:tetratricopeptide repeat protein 12-like n=1 Tax=Cryptotermes secundus TaxID=105785 RepID=UPI001454DE3D|nr:tetratricopeptide repeat protein 12-like [Cryptotermes secundus]
MDEEYNNFLQKVEEVTSILNSMKSNDPTVVANATQRADLFLQNTERKVTFNADGLRVKTNKTIINKKAFESNPRQNDAMSSEAFMAYVEKDAAARAAEKKERKATADGYMKKANEAFRARDYERALDLYNKATEQVKDCCLLYTNRALTYLNLNLYSRAISDCEWAHKLNENNLKAWLYKARAYHEMGDEKKTADCLKEAESRNPDSKAQIEAYICLWKTE